MINMNTKHFIVRTVGLYGSWGKGETLLDAAMACKKAGGKLKSAAEISIVYNDPDAFIDQYGALCYGGKDHPEAQLIDVGYAKLSGLLLAFLLASR
jgi:hypothetical protein